MLLHARGIEHQTKGVENVLSAINLGLATGKFGKPGCGVTTITGQGNGQGGREHGHKCDQLPGNRDITNPEHRAYIASVWGCDGRRHPRQGPHRRRRSSRRSTPGEIKGLLSICFNPAVSLPDTTFTARGARQARVLRASSTSSCPRPRHHADVVLPGLAARGGRGHVDQRRGAGHQAQPVASPAGQGPPRLGDPLRPRRPARQGPLVPVPRAPRRSSRSCGSRRRAAPPTTGASPGSGSSTRWACSGPARPRATRARRGSSRAGASTTPTAGPGSTPSPTGEPAEVVDDEYPVWLTTGRVVSQYLSGTQTRRIGPLGRPVPRAAVRDPPAARRAASASPTATACA